MGHNMSVEVLVPTSIGELVDKITILELKIRFINDPSKLENVRRELDALTQIFAPIQEKAPAGTSELIDQLREINGKLWVVEDDLRDLERAKSFGEDFIRLARAVYFTNDERAAVKKKLNILLGSKHVEEKSYSAYN
ncbi:DUF6165 family protein [Roseomonas xinghualingensis]|uniref:DUF6165 family protein n=1 Tax=Roseomonas xinghualingensis TaxID=2986475 RepID=UPI0021F0AB65|nr:DUF6165 family protein [Roseomonas sp. SXEYE001]MCV4208670.1 DUF6165 family protein [Roseomonas sp. SXEYE001]